MERSLYHVSERARKIVIVILIGLLIVLLIDTFYRASESGGPGGSNTVSYYMPVNRVFEDIPIPAIDSIPYGGEVLFQITSVHDQTQFPDVAYVYKLQAPRGKLNVFEQQLDNIDTVLGFDDSTREEVDTNLFAWTKDGGTKTLTYERVLERWVLSTQFYQNPAALSEKDLSDNTELYKNRTRAFISQMDFDTFGLTAPYIDVQYSELTVDGSFEQVSRADLAEFVHINAYRQLELADIAEPLPELAEGQTRPTNKTGIVYNTDPRDGSVQLIVSNQMSNLSSDIFRLRHTQYTPEVDTETGSVLRGAYQLVTPDEAWDNASISGSLVSLIPQQANQLDEYPENVEIRSFQADPTRTELGYWQEDSYETGFLYPIYIFRGTAQLADGRIASFTFYVDAIKRIDR